MMRTALYKLVGPIRAWAYWQLMNHLRGTRVEGGGVSPRARLGRHVIVRRGTEVGPDVVVGDFSYISGPRAYVEAARIGKFCSIARQVVIGPSDHDIQSVTTHPFPMAPAYGGLVLASIPVEQKKPPVIGNDVWIGINSIIMRGVVLGDGSVVAANSVVTRDVEPYTVVAGVPARPIKTRFSAEVVEAISASRWWDWNEVDLVRRIDDFRKPELFARKYGGDAK